MVENGIEVALTTTGYINISGSENSPNEIELLILDIPVCVVNISAMLLNINDTLRSIINESLLSSFNVVHIETFGKNVFIGNDPDIEETGMVIYHEESCNPQSEGFFKRWEETETLLFEFSILSLSTPVRLVTCLSGLWAHGSWKNLKIVKTPRISIHEGM